jgi:hypothetical protein
MLRRCLSAWKAIAWTPAAIDDAPGRFDFQGSHGRALGGVEEGNRFVGTMRPSELAKAEQRGDPEAAAQLDCVLRTLLAACPALARELEPCLPAAAVPACRRSEARARPRREESTAWHPPLRKSKPCVNAQPGARVSRSR